LSAVEPLSALLDLQPAGEDAFTAPTHGPDAGVRRIYGGHVAGQALLAAVRTVEVEGRLPHSIHGAFVRSGRPGVDLRMDVRRDRDGRSFSTRQVRVSQGPNVIFELMASFHDPEPGGDWTATPGPPGVPDPDALPDHRTFLSDLPTLSVFDMKVVDTERPQGLLAPVHPLWIRTAQPLPEDPAVHRAVLASMTDAGSVHGSREPGFAHPPGSYTGASLDHAVWFHRPARADEWLLLDMDPLSNHAGRGFGIGRAWTRDGTHVATWVQETLLRIG
jgi:acyl-CoA thioesterase II